MIVNGLASVNTPASGAAGSSTNTAINPASSTQSMFLQLLVAQLQNQSPLDPVDPTQFTSQLVQFNMLDQLTQINNTLTNTFAPPPPSSNSSGNSSNSIQGGL
jgi:flagellar basal-body rod modification protein FlgD